MGYANVLVYEGGKEDWFVSSAASRLAVGFFVFPLVATVPSPDVKYVT